MIILSVINLPGTNADCSDDIIKDKINFNRLAKTLKAILNSTLQRLIGLNWGNKTEG
jgi:hypothetical protein